MLHWILLRTERRKNGKNLKGKELGKGVCQKRDGMYLARFYIRYGRRLEKCFRTIPEAKSLLDEARYQDKYSAVLLSSDTTVNEWYDFRMDNIVHDIAHNTRRNYRERYMNDAQPIIDDLKMSEVKPLHYQRIFKRMEANYAGSTMRQTYVILGAIFKSAIENDMMVKHPLDTVRTAKPIKLASDINFLSLDEERVHVSSESIHDAIRKSETRA